MNKFRPYKEFTAHGEHIATLGALHRTFQESGYNHDLIKPIIVFTAFSIEAYVNHLGTEHLGIWDEIERLPWKKKITILYKATNKEPRWGEMPLQFANHIFSLRDKLAHGKPELVYGPECETEQQALEKMREPDLYFPKWYKDINKDWVLASKKSFDDLISHLGGIFERGETDQKILAYTGVEKVDEKA